MALALEQERRVTDQIADLTRLARDESDAVGEQFLHWFLQEQREEVSSMSALLAAVGTTVLLWTWPKLSRWLAAQVLTDRAMAIVALMVVVSDLAQYAQWATARTHLNHRASQELGDVLAAVNGVPLSSRVTVASSRPWAV